MRIRKRPDLPGGSDVQLITSVSDALAHPVRLELFKYIMQKNKNMELVCTGDLVDTFQYAQATISQHMTKLTVAGLVDSRTQNKHTYYFANTGVLSKYLSTTKNFVLE